jgi:hypothetical protein
LLEELVKIDLYLEKKLKVKKLKTGDGSAATDYSAAVTFVSFFFLFFLIFY